MTETAKETAVHDDRAAVMKHRNNQITQFPCQLSTHQEYVTSKTDDSCYKQHTSTL